MAPSNRGSLVARLRGLLLALALLLAPLGLAAAPALAAPSCSTSGTTVTCTFSYSGAPETWVVPAGVTSATFDLYGASGRGLVGLGGRVTATLAVTPGDTYQIRVGDAGGSIPGSSRVGTSYNGGGVNGGGGASDVRSGAFGLADRLLVAGGGGGAGLSTTAPGGHGGYPSGGAGGIGGGGGGGGGTQTAGGAAGGNGGAGSLGQGGAGGSKLSSASFDGGGGGGGYYGGGGGGGGDGGTAGGGGGGGSSYATPAASNVSYQTGMRLGEGLVIVSYTQPDTSAPTASPTQSPAANSNGWNNSAVTVSWNWADTSDGLGIDSANCTTSSSSSGEGVQALSATCQDLAGNQGSATYTVQVDTTAPTISAAASTSPNASGWYNGDVLVTFSCADNLSGLAGTCPASQTLSGEGASISSTAQSISDLAGNTSAPANVVTVAIDRTAPVVAVTGVSNGASYPLGSVPAAGCSTSDALSGVATTATLTISGGNPNGSGSFTATCAGATDNAGNSASASASYTVAYAWSGFLQPVDNLPTVNTAKAGASIPIKFSLGGNFGLNIFVAGYPKVQVASCTGSAAADEIEQTATAGASSLSYDAATGQYSYTWKTEKAWAGSCRLLTVRLSDGTDHSALFQFR